MIVFDNLMEGIGIALDISGDRLIFATNQNDALATLTRKQKAINEISLVRIAPFLTIAVTGNLLPVASLRAQCPVLAHKQTFP